MKNYLIILSLFITVFSVAQVDSEKAKENPRYHLKESAVSANVAAANDPYLSGKIAAFKAETAKIDHWIKTIDPGSNIITNDPHFPIFLKEFYASAIYYQVDYAAQLISLKKVSLIEAELNFIGGVVEIQGGQEIWLNSKLLLYPNLLRAIFYRQMGILYDIKEDKNSKNLDFMSDRWEISPKYENWAYNRRQRSTQKRIFFEKLAEKHPLKKQL